MPTTPRSFRARGTARRAALGLLAFASLGAGLSSCALHTDHLTCLDRAPTSPDDYQQAFAQRGIWAGGDGAQHVTLPDGRTLWLFGDTFVDGLHGDGSPAGAFINNSIVVQSGACFQMRVMGGKGERTAALRSSVGDAWVWPTSATIDPAGVVRIVGLRMARSPGPVGWDWRVAGTDIATLSLPDLQFLGTKPAPVPQNGRLTFGGSSLTVGGTVYVYGRYDDHLVVARASVAGMVTEPWQFLTAEGWSTDVNRAVAPGIEQAPFGQLTVVPHAGGYLASSKSMDVISDDVTTWFGPTPTGPFRRLGRAATTSSATGWFTYGGRVVDLPGAGLVAVWSQNADAGSGITDVRPYGPRFAPLTPGSLP